MFLLSFSGSCQSIRVSLKDGMAKPKSSFSVFGFQKPGLWIAQGKVPKDLGVTVYSKASELWTGCVCAYPGVSGFPRGYAGTWAALSKSVSNFPCPLFATRFVYGQALHLRSVGFLLVFFSHLPFPHFPSLFTPILVVVNKPWVPTQGTLK